VVDPSSVQFMQASEVDLSMMIGRRPGGDTNATAFVRVRD